MKKMKPSKKERYQKVFSRNQIEMSKKTFSIGTVQPCRLFRKTINCESVLVIVPWAASLCTHSPMFMPCKCWRKNNPRVWICFSQLHDYRGKRKKLTLEDVQRHWNTNRVCLELCGKGHKYADQLDHEIVTSGRGICLHNTAPPRFTTTPLCRTLQVVLFPVNPHQRIPPGCILLGFITNNISCFPEKITLRLKERTSFSKIDETFLTTTFSARLKW